MTGGAATSWSTPRPEGPARRRRRDLRDGGPGPPARRAQPARRSARARPPAGRGRRPSRQSDAPAPGGLSSMPPSLGARFLDCIGLTDVLSVTDPPVTDPTPHPRRSRLVTPTRVGVGLLVLAGIGLRWFILTHALGVLDAD